MREHPPQPLEQIVSLLLCVLMAAPFLDVEQDQLSELEYVPRKEPNNRFAHSLLRKVGFLLTGLFFSTGLVLESVAHPARPHAMIGNRDIAGLTGLRADVSWSKHEDTFLNLYAGGVSDVMTLKVAKVKCVKMGSSCFGVTCGYDATFGTGREGSDDWEESCTVRAGECSVHGLYGCPEGKYHGLQESPTHEVSYVKYVGDANKNIEVDAIGRSRSDNGAISGGL